MLQSLEEENNRLFINAYGLQDELSPEVPEDQIILARADREKDCQRLISYAIGCMMGRYSLDEPGLIYAHAGNVGFDATRYQTFPADADGIVPLTDDLWFEDDAANRIREFLLAVWGADSLEENMDRRCYRLRVPSGLVRVKIRVCANLRFSEVAIMASVCEVCGKKPSFGMSVSHSHIRTKRRWNPNINASGPSSTDHPSASTYAPAAFAPVKSSKTSPANE